MNREACLILKLALACGATWLGLPEVVLAQKKGKKPAGNTVTEVFHVSNVGKTGVAETREVLSALYKNIATQYNTRTKQEKKTSPQLFKGDRLRVIRKLDEPDLKEKLYLVAYDGQPAVLVVEKSTQLVPGKFTPPLILTEAGEHKTEFTRRAPVKKPNQPEPALEVVEEGENEPVTFFGIPIDTEDGGGSSPESGKSKGKKGKKRKGKSTANKTEFETITETRTLKQIVGKVSTEKLNGDPARMTTDLLTTQLKNGEVYAVTRQEQRRCQECRGFGRVQSTKPLGAREPDGKMNCPECKAKGSLDWKVTYKVVW